MPTGLDPISDEELRPGDARGRLRTIRKLAAMYNAWLNPQIRHDTGKEDVQFSDSNVVIEYLQGTGGGGGGGGTSAPTPFQLVQQADKTNVFYFNDASYFKTRATNSNYYVIGGLGTPVALADGLCGWLQVDATVDGSGISEVNIATGQTPPYQTNGGQVVTTGGSGQPNDPYIWNQTFCLLFQCFAADPSGNPIRGGIVYTVDGQGTKYEVVQQTFSNLSLQGKIVAGAYCYLCLPDSAPLIS